MSKTHLSSQEIVKRVEEWQRAGHVHPLTCGRDSSHPPLKPELKVDNSVVLVCPQCSYVQKRIPETVLGGIPPMPVIRPKRSAEVIISRQDWGALLTGKDIRTLRLFSESELHFEFGDCPENYKDIVRV